MKRTWFGCAILCALVVLSGCRAPSPNWNGMWKLNLTKSSYQGQVLTISISADGEYRFDESSGEGEGGERGGDMIPISLHSV